MEVAGYNFRHTIQIVCIQQLVLPYAAMLLYMYIVLQFSRLCVISIYVCFCSVILHYTDEGYCKVAETSVLK